MSAERQCSCGTPGLTYDGPMVDCDVHGLPSAAFQAGYRQGCQDERDQARIRGDLCRWCHRQPQPQLGERHGVPEHHGAEGDDVEMVCLNEFGHQLAHGHAHDETAF